MVILIGLCGSIGSGKDTCATILESRYLFQRFSFASPIKDIVSTLFGWNREALEGTTPSTRIWRETEDPWWSMQLGVSISPRKMLQLIGTDMFRNILSPQFWTTVIKRKILSSSRDRIVITDCRFPEEIDLIRSLGGIIVKIDRNILSHDITISHSSESYISSIIPDATIDNTKTINYLQDQIDTLFQYITNENVFSKNQN
jgi:hypothetical protein